MGGDRFLLFRSTTKTRIIGPCARTLDLPLLVRSGVFYFSVVSDGQIFGVFFAPFPKVEILDYIAHGPTIRVLTGASPAALALASWVA